MNGGVKQGALAGIEIRRVQVQAFDEADMADLMAAMQAWMSDPARGEATFLEVHFLPTDIAVGAMVFYQEA